jgi:hypothetical protein
MKLRLKKFKTLEDYAIPYGKAGKRAFWKRLRNRLKKFLRREGE